MSSSKFKLKFPPGVPFLHYQVEFTTPLSRPAKEHSLFYLKVYLADKLRQDNSLLILPPSIPPHPVVSLLAFNYLSFPRAQIVWLTASSSRLRMSKHYLKTFIKLHTRGSVLDARKISEVKHLTESAMIFTDARTFIIDLEKQRYDFLFLLLLFSASWPLGR